MKKSTFIGAALMLIVCTVNAQTEKGNWVVGATVGSGAITKSNSNSKNSNTTTENNSESNVLSLSAGPFGMYFLNDNLAIGSRVGINFSGRKSEHTNTIHPNISYDNYNAVSLSIGPQIRKYFGEPGSNGQPWVEVFGGLSMGNSKSKSSNTSFPNKSEYETKSTGWQAGLGAGYSHFLNRHLALQYYVNFRRTHSANMTDAHPTPGSPYSYSSSGDENVLGFGVGLAIHLPSKK